MKIMPGLFLEEHTDALILLGTGISLPQAKDKDSGTCHPQPALGWHQGNEHPRTDRSACVRVGSCERPDENMSWMAK